MVDKKEAGLIGTILILAIFGGTQYLETTENVYVCELTEEIGIFERLSGTSKTGYYFEDGIEKKDGCNKGRIYGQWTPIKEYCEERGISTEDLLNKEKIIINNNYSFNPGAKYKCSPEGCERIN